MIDALLLMREAGISFEVCMKIAKRIGQHWIDNPSYKDTKLSTAHL